VIRQKSGAIVRLGDVADVVLGAESYDDDVRFSGQKATFMGVWPLPNANTLDVVRAVREALPEIESRLPTGMKSGVAYDSTVYIESAIRDVLKTLTETLLIVVVVIFLFMGSLRTVIIPVVDVMRKVSLRTVTMPIQSQGIITKDNVSIDVAGVAYFHVVDAVKSVVVIENVDAAVNQIAQTTLRNVVGQHTLDQALSETDAINQSIREILDRTTTEWGVLVTLVELKDIQLPESMKRAMARQAEAEREKRAKIIAAEGESAAAAALGEASDIMMAHPLALQLRNLQSLVEIGVDKNTTVVFPAPLMSTIADLGAFLRRETRAAGQVAPERRAADRAGAPAMPDPLGRAEEPRGPIPGAAGRRAIPVTIGR